MTCPWCDKNLIFRNGVFEPPKQVCESCNIITANGTYWAHLGYPSIFNLFYNNDMIKSKWDVIETKMILKFKKMKVFV